MMFYFFFFKQKTAYEMRISDWSSDVCSSDLPPALGHRHCPVGRVVHQEGSDPAPAGPGAYPAADRRHRPYGVAAGAGETVREGGAERMPNDEDGVEIDAEAAG